MKDPQLEDIRLQAMDYSSCGITLADCRQEDMPLVYINEAFSRITGYSPEETVGRNCRFLQGDDRDQPELEELRAALREQRPCQVVFRNYRKDGSLFFNELIMSPIFDTEGTLTHFVGVQSDVTERTKALAEMTRKSSELEGFAHIVSHDLRAPLRHIGTLSTMLIEDEAERLSENGREMIELMDARVNRLKDLIEGILSYSLAGRDLNEDREIDLGELLGGVIDLLHPPPHIQIQLPDVLPRVSCDRTLMGQVFQNLIGNAIKYMDKPEGLITLDCEDHGADWLFSIRDNGPGVAPEYHERIFQLFQTLQSRDDVESSGVGLATVRKYVERVGGRIWIESDSGDGSTFSFTWPKAPR